MGLSNFGIWPEKSQNISSDLTMSKGKNNWIDDTLTDEKEVDDSMDGEESGTG